MNIKILKNTISFALNSKKKKKIHTGVLGPLRRETRNKNIFKTGLRMYSGGGGGGLS